MKNANWKVYTLWIGLAEAAGLLSSLLSRVGMVNFSQTVAQPPLSPPGWLFPVVWTILYGLMGISAARIWLSPPSDSRSRGLNRFLAQLIVNFFWSPIFFNTGAYGFSLLWLLLLWVLVVLMIRSFRKVDKTTALLQIPYLIWLTFGAYLNWGVWKLNP